MEDWQIDFEWLRIQHFVQDSLGQEELPDMNVVLTLVGVQELGQVKDEFTKEEKQDLMHIAVCTLLEDEGYYEFIGRDHDGWPHWKKLKKVDVNGVVDQEKVLKLKIVEYFKNNHFNDESNN